MDKAHSIGRFVLNAKNNSFYKGRDYYFDNAKFLLIFLVVFAHLIEPFRSESNLVLDIYQFIYLFHMPAFFFIAGVFAKYSKNHIQKSRNLFFLYAIAQVLFYTVDKIFGKEQAFHFFTPKFSLWFLFSLATYHIIYVLFSKIPLKVQFGISLLIGVFLNFDTALGHPFSISRTFVFLPFFIAGLLTDKNSIKKLKDIRFSTFIGSIILLTIFIYIRSDMPFFPRGFLNGRNSYETLDLGKEAIIYGLFRYIGGGLAMIGGILITPNQKLFFSNKGKNTLSIYLLHSLILIIAKHFDVLPWIYTRYNILGLLVFSILLVAIFSADFFNSIATKVLKL